MPASKPVNLYSGLHVAALNANSLPSSEATKKVVPSEAIPAETPSKVSSFSLATRLAVLARRTCQRPLRPTQALDRLNLIKDDSHSGHAGPSGNQVNCPQELQGDGVINLALDIDLAFDLIADLLLAG